jgi:hypothetical protein
VEDCGACGWVGGWVGGCEVLVVRRSNYTVVKGPGLLVIFLLVTGGPQHLLYLYLSVIFVKMLAMFMPVITMCALFMTHSNTHVQVKVC